MLERRVLTVASPDTINPTIPATSEVLAEAETLSADILRDIELSQVRLSMVVLRALRLARLLNDFEMQQIFEWESGGYPRGISVASPEVWGAGTTTGRMYYGIDSTPEAPKTYIYTESIEQMERTLEMGAVSLQSAQDPNVSLSSANQLQIVSAPPGNAIERSNIRNQLSLTSQRLASRRTFIYDYVARKHYELKFAGIADDVFGRIRSSVGSIPQ